MGVSHFLLFLPFPHPPPLCSKSRPFSYVLSDSYADVLWSLAKTSLSAFNLTLPDPTAQKFLEAISDWLSKSQSEAFVPIMN